MQARTHHQGRHIAQLGSLQADMGERGQGCVSQCTLALYAHSAIGERCIVQCANH
jgi:hypothetical protein